MNIPTEEEFSKGIGEYEEKVGNSIYNVAKFYVSHFWGNPSDMSDGVEVFLLTWNQAFYRFGSFSSDKLKECIADNIQKLSNFRNKDISNLSMDDENDIKELFVQFLEALQIDSGKKQGTKSPVSVAKALHLLAPHFFPLWDTAIARYYMCYYDNKPAEKYILFCNMTKTIADRVRNYKIRSPYTLCKLIDEYNYSKCTKGWV